ncbi:MAG: SGNH/GDSL hydrolase family protein [Candidatus Dadabacteria bacterium]|nr:MAG: SGNH/GDSL hydrolase family protein [Candidatus Dadabacteria bacterium]
MVVLGTVNSMKENKHIFVFAALCVVALAFFLEPQAYPCPLISSTYPDRNGGCDGVFKIATFGDSVTKGRGDDTSSKTDRSGKTVGGWPLRLNRYLKNLGIPHNVKNFGLPGKTCQTIRTKLRRTLKHLTYGATKYDLVFINCGLNNYWTDDSATKVAAIIKSMKRFASRKGAVAVVARVTKTRRSFQNEWVDELNNAIKGFASLRFDVLKTRQLSTDMVHPNSKGYDKLFEKVKEFIDGSYILKAPRTDSDGDGVYDKFELTRFGTDPTLKDTDGDGVNDGAELFTSHTDPLNASDY